MGLDTSHGCYHGGYGSFNLWRHWVAKVAGIPLPLMDGYWEGPRTWPLHTGWINPAGEHIGVEDWCLCKLLPLSWEPLKGHPLVPLLNHSDCDGRLTHSTLKPMAGALRSILRKTSNSTDQLDVRMRAITKQFIAGLLRADKMGERVDFH